MKKRSHLNILWLVIARRLRSGQWITYGVCLCVAVVFWYINKLDNTYSQEVNLRVKYINYPEKKVVMQPPVDRMQIGLKAKGFSMFQYVYGLDFSPLMLNVSALLPEMQKDGQSLYLLTSSVRELIEAYYGGDCEIGYVRPDTLWFSFDDLVTRDVPVEPSLALEAERNYDILTGETRVDPAVVQMSGPGSMLDTIRAVPTLPVQHKHLSDTLDLRVRLLIPDDSRLKVKQQKVRVTVPVVRKPQPEKEADDAETQTQE